MKPKLLQPQNICYASLRASPNVATLWANAGSKILDQNIIGCEWQTNTLTCHAAVLIATSKILYSTFHFPD